MNFNSVLVPFSNHNMKDFFINRSFIDTPSLSRHTPNNDGVLIRESKDKDGNIFSTCHTISNKKN